MPCAPLATAATGYNSPDFRLGCGMDNSIKKRLIGAAVLALVAMAILPGLLARPDVKEPDAADVPLDLPKAPDEQFETHELSLAAPERDAPAGGVLGLLGEKTPAALAEPVAPAPASTVAASLPATVPAVAAPPAAPAAPAVLPTAPAPPPVAVPVPATAVAAGHYAVTVGTFGNLANADQLAAKLRAAQMPVMADKVMVNGKAAMRLRVGPYADRAAAEAARLRADGVSGAAGKVVTLDAAPAAAPAPAPAAKPAGPAPTAGKPPVAASASAKPPAATAASASGFAVQLAAPAEESAAIALRDRARAAGFASFVQRVDTDDGARYRVRVGPVADRDAANALRAAVNQKLGIGGNIVAYP